MSDRHTWRCVHALLMLLLLAAPVRAQQETALAGRVVDGSGGVVPGATVVATSSTGVSRTMVTDREGRFAFPGIPAGTYDVQAQVPGFAPALARGITAAANGETAAIELRLEAGGVSERVTITATRGATPIAALPTSVTVLNRESLDEQAALSRNLHTILGKTLPGFGLSRESESNFGQNLRGRGMLVLLDGVPQNFELRQGALDELSRIDPSRIERIEVVRGASAAYGSEAAGGIINIITG